MLVRRASIGGTFYSFLPNNDVAAIIVVPEIALVCRARFAVIIPRGIGEVGVRGANRNFSPLCFRAVIIHAREARAFVERQVTDARDGVADCHAREAGTFVERIVTDALNRVANHNARETRTIVERPLTDARHRVANYNAREAGAFVEGIVTDAITAYDNNGF